MLGRMRMKACAAVATRHLSEGEHKTTLRAGMDSPVGPLTIVVEDNAVVALDWVRPHRDDDHPVLLLSLIHI